MNPKKKYEEKDRISNLSDDILHQILSYLDAIDVVRTSQLSSRWQNLWKSVPRISLQSPKFHLQSNSKFLSFVSGFLSSPRSTVSQVSTIRIRFSRLDYYETSDYASYEAHLRVLEQLVSYSISHKTEVLEIDSCCIPQLLSRIDSPFLKQLTLKRNWHVFNDDQFCWNLPALTTLELVFVDFKASHCVDLFSQFSNLKHLKLIDCVFSLLDDFGVHSCGLVDLVIKHHWNDVYRPTCKFVVSAPKLSCFTYIGDDLPILLSTNDVGALESVKIDFMNVALVDTVLVGERMLNIFSQVANVVYLEVSLGVLKLLSRVPKLLKRQQSPFNDLKTLKFVMGRTPCLQVIPSDVDNYFVKSSPFVTIIKAIRS